MPVDFTPVFLDRFVLGCLAIEQEQDQSGDEQDQAEAQTGYAQRHHLSALRPCSRNRLTRPGVR
jgi:hypothetical protein